VNGYHPSYNTSTNRIVGLTYDAVGNLTQDGTKTMGYDANNKLVSATATGGGTVSYLY
jgi:YD repeat-containing protein